MSDVQAGVYRHYKGHDYQVFSLVRHSETEQVLVVYRCLYEDFSWWVRPLDMFQETVEIDGQCVARFAYVKPFVSGDYPTAPGLPMFDAEGLAG